MIEINKFFLETLATVDLVNDIIKMGLDDLGNLSKNLKMFLIELKMRVDRWDLITSDFIFHSSMESLVKQVLLKEVYVAGDNVKIWGANILFSPEIPSNCVFAVDSVTDREFPDNRYIAKGLLPDIEINRALSLKAFW